MCVCVCRLVVLACSRVLLGPVLTMYVPSITNHHYITTNTNGIPPPLFLSSSLPLIQDLGTFVASHPSLGEDDGKDDGGDMMGGETGDGDIMNIKSSTARADAIAALRAGAAGRTLGGGEGKEGGMVLDGSLESKAEKLAAFKAAKAAKAGPSEMVTPLQERSLKKEGYKIIGTHSAVKLCRWTKNQLRGRGGCYKHTMYGITSYQCMETTPSLACANKCVFCGSVGSPTTYFIKGVYFLFPQTPCEKRRHWGQFAPPPPIGGLLHLSPN